MIKIKIYHIVSHILESSFPQQLKEKKDYVTLEYTVNKIILSLKKYAYDTETELEHIMLIPSKKFGIGDGEIIHKDGYKILFFKTTQFISYPFEYSGELMDYIKNIDDGVIHIYGTGSFLYDCISFKLKNKPSIAHYMGGHFTWKFFPVSFIKYFLIQPLTLRFPKILFIQNQYRIQQYNRMYRIPLGRMKFVPGAVQISDFGEKKYIENPKIQLFFASRIERAKGIFELVTVFRKLREKYTNISLVIAGQGTQVDTLKKLILQDDAIIFLGNLDYHSLIKELYQSDIFVLPTHFDCFPSALLEAGAASLPVVSTQVEGPMSIVQNHQTGFLVPVGNTDELYKKIEQLIGSPSLRKEFSENARKFIESNFIWEKVASLYFETYKSLYKELK